jgi:hypothetical protein
LGVVVYTRVQTPRFCGHPANAGTADLVTFLTRGLRTSWFIVAIKKAPKIHYTKKSLPYKTKGNESYNE